MYNPGSAEELKNTGDLKIADGVIDHPPIVPSPAVIDPET